VGEAPRQIATPGGASYIVAWREPYRSTSRIKPMRSPCIKVCSIDRATGLCAGCGRSSTEIAGWIGMSDAERDRIMAELPARRRRPARDV